jgi:hypothetical protein
VKLRSGFVANSSSTSFLIIANGDFTRQDLKKLLGVNDSSPLAPFFEQLYDDIRGAISAELDLGHAGKNVPTWAEGAGRRRRLSERMLEKLESSRKEGYRAYFGYLDSETSPVQTFFCTDSFEEEDEKIYLNALECAW